MFAYHSYWIYYHAHLAKYPYSLWVWNSCSVESDCWQLAVSVYAWTFIGKNAIYIRFIWFIPPITFLCTDIHRKEKRFTPCLYDTFHQSQSSPNLDANDVLTPHITWKINVMSIFILMDSSKRDVILFAFAEEFCTAANMWSCVICVLGVFFVFVFDGKFVFGFCLFASHLTYVRRSFWSHSGSSQARNPKPLGSHNWLHWVQCKLKTLKDVLESTNRILGNKLYLQFLSRHPFLKWVLLCYAFSIKTSADTGELSKWVLWSLIFADGNNIPHFVPCWEHYLWICNYMKTHLGSLPSVMKHLPDVK